MYDGSPDDENAATLRGGRKKRSGKVKGCSAEGVSVEGVGKGQSQDACGAGQTAGRGEMGRRVGRCSIRDASQCMCTVYCTVGYICYAETRECGRVRVSAGKT